MELLRRKLVYELFIDQFIVMSQVTMKYQAFDHGLHLLKQATRLVDLLTDDKHIEESQKLFEKVESLKEHLLQLKSENVQGPELPRRISIFDSNNKSYQTSDNVNSEEEIPSEDDNDEIYSYHQSVVVQIHSTTAENLARFQHSDESDDDEVESITKSIENFDLDNATKL